MVKLYLEILLDIDIISNNETTITLDKNDFNTPEISKIIEQVEACEAEVTANQLEVVDNRTKRQKVESSKGKGIGVALLMATHRNAYNFLREQIINNLNLPSYEIPIFHYITKHRPKIESGILSIDKDFSILSRESQIKKEIQKKKNDNEKKRKRFYIAIMLD